MIHTEFGAGLDTELQHRVDTLARLVRGTPRFIDALRAWLGFDVAQVPRAPDAEHALAERDALLDVPPGTTVIRRDGYLVAALGGAPSRVAEVTALVRTAGVGLDLEQKAALRSGTTPLGQILCDAHRATHYAYRVDGAPVDDQPALRSRATLLRGGRPVVLVWEAVLWKALTHRVPGQLPGYAQVPVRVGVG